MSSPYKFSEWTYVDKAIAENHHICTRCHSDITSDHIGKPVLITYDGDNVEYICPDCTADFFFYSLGKTLEALNCDPVDTEQDEEDRKERLKNAEIPLWRDQFAHPAAGSKAEQEAQNRITSQNRPSRHSHLPDLHRKEMHRRSRLL